MKRLILTSSSGTELIHSDLADFIVVVSFRFVGGPLPSPNELAIYASEKTDTRSHWSRMTFAGVHRRGDKTPEGLELVEFC